jgi:hypothetical protein
MSNNLNNPDLLIVNVPRCMIQGGLTNDEYGKIDYRLLHIFTTGYAKKWKGCKDIGADSRFTDICNRDFKSEGKRYHNTDYIEITPSRDIGADRKFNKDNLEEALDLNDAYYFYKAEFINDHQIRFKIYWCPIRIVKQVYSTKGNGKGRINQVKKNLIEPYFNNITPTEWNIPPPSLQQPQDQASS